MLVSKDWLVTPGWIHGAWAPLSLLPPWCFYIFNFTSLNSAFIRVVSIFIYKKTLLISELDQLYPLCLSSLATFLISWIPNVSKNIQLDPFVSKCAFRVCLHRVPKNFKFVLLKMNFFYIFKLFWCADAKNNFFKKKLYFYTFLSEKHFEPATVTIIPN